MPAGADPALRRFLDAPMQERPDPAIVATAQRVFGEHGPEILTTLACYALPAAYAANDGVRVLAQTGFLESFPNRRLVETTQMVVNVMRPGAFDPGGVGIRTVRKVRLMHAAIRHLILGRSEPRWDTEALGVPINQEDLAGTLMTFAWLPLDGLRKMGVQLRPDERTAFVRFWAMIGRELGVDETLRPEDTASAERLTRQIQTHQIHTALPNPDGQALTRALLEMMEDHVPLHALRFGPPSLMRVFLPSKVADALAVPRHLVADPLVALLCRTTGLVDRLLLATALQRRVFRSFTMSIAQAVLDHERGGKRTAFELPLSLRGRWQRH